MSSSAAISRRTCIVSCFTATFTGCMRNAEHDASIPEQVGHWPDVTYQEVRGYSFNFAGSPIARIFDKAGELDSSVREKLGVALNADHVARLLKVVRNPEKVSWATGCGFTPRHAFVFYDAQKPVAQLEVCFECYQMVAKPSMELRGVTFDYGELDAIFKELGIPGKLEADEYRRLVKAEQSATTAL